MDIVSNQELLLVHETCIFHKKPIGGCTYQMQSHNFKTVLKALSEAFGALVSYCIQTITLYGEVLIFKMVPPLEWISSETEAGHLCSRAVVTFYENLTYDYVVTTAHGVIKRQSDSEDFEEWQIGLHLCLQSAMRSGLLLRNVERYMVQGQSRVRLVFDE